MLSDSAGQRWTSDSILDRCSCKSTNTVYSRGAHQYNRLSEAQRIARTAHAKQTIYCPSAPAGCAIAKLSIICLKTACTFCLSRPAGPSTPCSMPLPSFSAAWRTCSSALAHSPSTRWRSHHSADAVRSAGLRCIAACTKRAVERRCFVCASPALAAPMRAMGLCGGGERGRKWMSSGRLRKKRWRIVQQVSCHCKQ